MQYKYNKNTDSLELVNRNSIIVNNVVSSGSSGNSTNGDAVITITTETPEFYGKQVILTDGENSITTLFSNEGIAIFKGVEMEGKLTASVTIDENIYTTNIEIKSNYKINFNPENYYTFTVRLDWSDENSATWGTWLDDAQTILTMPPRDSEGGYGESFLDEFMGYYPCTLDSQGNEIDVLNPNNYAKTINGNDLQESTRVMVKFKNRGYRIWNDPDNSNYTYVSITNRPGLAGYEYIKYKNQLVDSFYVGAYQGTVDDKGRLLSKSGAAPSVSKSLSDFRNYAHNNGTNFEQFTFNIYTYLCCCAVIKYRGETLRNALGYGYVRSSYGLDPSGNRNEHGLNWGKYNNMKDVKLFGIENLWGNVTTFVEGIAISSDSHYRYSTGPFSNDFSTYTDLGSTSLQLPSQENFFIDGLIATDSRLGFMPSKGTPCNGLNDTSYDNKYLATTAYQNKQGSKVCFQGCEYNYGSSANLIRTAFFLGPDESYGYTGARLVYFKPVS